MAQKKPKNIFIEGPISPEKIAQSIANHQHKTNIGAHDIFLGQVRADTLEGKEVKAINYTAYDEMAIETVICFVIPYIEHMSEIEETTALYPRCFSGKYDKSKCTPSTNISVETIVF